MCNLRNVTHMYETKLTRALGIASFLCSSASTLVIMCSISTYPAILRICSNCCDADTLMVGVIIAQTLLALQLLLFSVKHNASH